MLGAGEVISYLDMCRAEGVNLQRGMNYGRGKGQSVILMSLRKGAPYADRIGTESKAKAELRARLVDVEREGRRKLEPLKFGAFARDWVATYPDTKGLKRSTREGYESIIERHLIPEFGALKLEAIGVKELDRYLARKSMVLQPRTLNRT